jgi:hypothetical protein
MEYRKFMNRIGVAIGKNADRINEESWRDDVLTELDKVSIECAKQPQAETGTVFKKPARPAEGIAEYILQLHEAPPMRLLGLEIGLAAWLGWIMQEKHGDDPNRPFSSTDCLKRITDAFNYGVTMSKNKELP